MKRICLITASLMLTATAALQAAGLYVLPNPAEVQVNASQGFTVQGLEPGSSLEWEVIPTSLGVIDRSGIFTASGKPGRGMVRAIAKGNDGRTALGHAMVTIVGNRPERFKVSLMPAQAELNIGQTLRFTVRNLLPDGTPEENAKTEWRVIPGDLGTVDDQGNFTAIGTGNGRIVALTKGSQRHGLGQARVKVLPSGKAAALLVTVSPKRIKLLPGGQNQVFVRVQDPEGIPVKARVRYSLSPDGLGTIDQEGNFTAGEKAGLGIIKVEAASGYSFGSDRAFVVVSESSSRYQIKIKPRQAMVETRSSTKFEVEVMDEAGSLVVPPSIEWKVIPDGLGSITPEGLFTAGDQALTGRIVAKLPPEFGRGQDAASVRVLSSGRNTIRITPPQASLKPGQMLQFTSVVFDGRGKPLDDVRMIWKLQPENIGTINPQGLFTAGPAARSGIIIAELPPELGSGRAIAPIAISSYLAKIDAPPNQYNIHNGEQVLFSASVRDANGNDLTGSASFEWELRSSVAGFGTIDRSSGLFQAGQPAMLPADGYIMVRAYLNGVAAGTDGIKITIK